MSDSVTIPVKGRILIVSNRLPVSVKQENGQWMFSPSVGGLATGLSSLHEEYETLWIGWPGSVEKADRPAVEKRLVNEFRSYPVFLSESLSQKFYEGFCNKSIWPLFHSLPSYAKFLASEWEAYQRANTLFARTVEQLYQPGDLVWIHDYHLMTMAKALRTNIPNAPMGFFLHIPFPHYEILRLMPQHREVLEGLLAFDLVGFHTHDYAQAFLGSVRRSMGYDNVLGQLLVDDRVMHVDVFPMGIDFEKYSTAAQDHDVRQDIERIRNRMRGHKTIFTVSRLDYTKGLPESLEAVREFFERYPDWHEEVVFVLVVVPSRENVATYAALKREINEMVGRLNSEYGNLDWTPIRYVYRSLRFGELVGLYCVANVALITPLRDGMNLIAKEYLAARSDETGVLIISEMAGASKELVEAIIVNPSSKEEIADAIHRALTMPVEEQRRRNALMRRRLAAQDVHQWVKRFFKRLQEAVEASQLLAVRMLDSASVETIRRAYREAHRRLFVLDYDGTLVPFADEPSMAKPDAELMAMLTKLQHIPANDVIVLSGRDRQTLEEWLAGTGVTLVAEHGAWRWSPQDRRWDLLLGGPDSEWKKEIRPIVQLFVDRIPGSFIEEKQYSLVWHYRKAESETATIAARELLDTVVNMATNLPIHVLPGNKTVEVRSFGVSKGIFFKRIVEAGLPEFIVAAGDDWTDEDLFAVLPDSAISIKVGLRISKARYNVKSYHDVRALLQSLEG